MASPTLITPTPTPTPSPTCKPKPVAIAIAPSLSKSKMVAASTSGSSCQSRRQLTLTALTAAIGVLTAGGPAQASSDEEYVKETEEVINKVRSTITLDKNDPNVADAVAQLRETSNSWVAKYRRDKTLLGRPSFRDIYSALNAVSGHYISFGPTAPIPAKRRARILEEMDTAEKALLRGR